ncbi:MAG: class I SAM-dependent methyltransferase [Pseudomonadota bacterium]
MKSTAAIRTTWTDSLDEDGSASAQSVRDHVLEVHRRHPGFTEGCATKCRDAAGRTSYDWLCDAAAPAPGDAVLDLACGSGHLLALCRERYGPNVDLIGVDMSAAELALAKKRLSGAGVALHEGLAQNLDVVADGAVDAVLCHWALTLMDPVEPALDEIARILSSDGVFAAIVDGDRLAAPGYAAVDDLIFDHVRAELPGYGEKDLGDPRTRRPDALRALATAHFPEADVSVETGVFALEGPPAALAQEAAGFFYAAFVLPPAPRARMLADLTAQFAADMARRSTGGRARFSMPAARLIVRRRGTAKTANAAFDAEKPLGTLF